MQRPGLAPALTALSVLCALLPVSAAQAASSGGSDAMFVHPSAAGDTLIGLGRRFLADPSRWPELQRVNAIRDPRRLPTGSKVRIPLDLMRTAAAPALLSAATGAVRSGDSAAVAGQALPEGSVLATGNDAMATVRLVDGTLLRLRAGGRMRIDESRRVLGTEVTRSAVKLEQGQVEVEASPARGGEPGFRIGTPQGVLGVRGTEFRVSSGADAQTRTEVLEGAVAASGRDAKSESQRVNAGFGTLIDATGQVAPPMALLPAPDLAGLPALFDRPLVRLSLPAMPGAAAWRVQLAADERFEHVLADLRSATPDVRFADLADGRYALRVRAVAANGLEGRDAQGVLTLKARPEPPMPHRPAPRAQLRGDSVELSWAANAQAQRYRLQVARLEGEAVMPAAFARPLVDVRDIAGLTFELQAITPGRYGWRLASVRADGDQGPFGDGVDFELSALPTRALPPGAVAPAPPTVGDHTIRIVWPGLPGQRFDLQLAHDDAFTRIVLQQQLDSTEIELPLPGTGRFHVRLRARQADGQVGPWSASQPLDVIPCVRETHGACVRVDGGALRLQ